MSRNSFRFKWLSVSLALATCGLPSAATAQNQRDDAGKPPAATDRNEGYGVLLSPHALDLLLERAADQMARQWGLDENQVEQAKAILKERVPKFLRENQAELQSLFDQFIEAQAGSEPPTAEFVAEWAKRATPMLGDARKMFGDVTEQMREFMDDDQQVQLDAALAAVDAGMNIQNRRLQGWAAGNYDPATEWHPNPGVQRMDAARAREVRDAMNNARRQALDQAYGGQQQPSADPAAQAADAAGGQPSPAPRPAKPAAASKDEWTQYVEKFIVDYALTPDQTQKAQMHLSAAQTERDRHLGGKGREMREVQERFKTAKDPVAVKSAEAAYAKLMKPVDNIFERLKQRLEKLPTREQRARATPAEPTADAGKSGARKP